MQPSAVLDSTTVVSGIGWRGDCQIILRLLASRRFFSIRTPYLTSEWSRSMARASTLSAWQNSNWANWLEWLKRASDLIGEPPVRPTVRDPKDDPILAAAIAGRAQYLVSYDKDFLDLGKPYGVECVRPHAFIRALLAKP
jgi:predicted nucleic acid-binding protein